MIAKWNVSNYKSIREETGLNFAPLTIFVGPNNSGKSAFIQSILLVSQTWLDNECTSDVILNGFITKLGQFKDLKSINGEKSRITIKYTLASELNKNDIFKLTSQRTDTQTIKTELAKILNSSDVKFHMYISCHLSFGVNPSSVDFDKMQNQPKIYFEKITSRIIKKNGDNNNVEVKLIPDRFRMETIEHFFRVSLKYLDSSGIAPKRIYPSFRGLGIYDIGLQGEDTASILEKYKNNKIRYIPSAYFKDGTIIREMVPETLENAVIDWLDYLGLAVSVTRQKKGIDWYEFKVKTSNLDALRNITQVGVGLSQVLPIIVMSLLAKDGSTLIFDHPENNLHPSTQLLLGDFFLAISLSKKQCILETHSEYIFDRLRFRIAASRLKHPLEKHVKMYFVEKQLDASSFREIVFNEYGAIVEWPDGLFDESLKETEKILQAASMKRKRNKK
ncbi:MAG: DUF3696 domain-containing protein [Deltaproteobacteria bacterium]|jgi:predicted ATPase|nr:DUF3696 domain-containing protein [Deltaproteobacteria bacterium]